MTNFELVTAADVQLMQGLAQRVTATRPDLVNSDGRYLFHHALDRAYYVSIERSSLECYESQGA
jgi:hypothetical protein